MKIEMQIILEVNNQAEKFYEDAVELGDHAAYALKDERKQSSHRSQLTSLENIAESAFKTSDIFDYIKRQTARHEQWRRVYPGHDEDKSFGIYLKYYLDTRLAEQRDAICSGKRLNIDKDTDIGRTRRRRVYLLLMRQFIRQMVIEYEFQLMNAKNAEKGA